MSPNPLKEIIISEILTKGPMPFDRFMSLALYHPQFGYYCSEDIAIGRSGDFYTSSHVHKAFGGSIALQLLEFWQSLGRPKDFHVIEVGAGSGYTALDILDFIKLAQGSQFEFADFAKSLIYHIVEISPKLRLRQKELLQGHQVLWHEELNFASNLTGCIFSNELFDAMPVKLVQNHEDLYEVFIDYDGKDLIETLKPAGDEIRGYFREFDVTLPAGYRTEVNLVMKDWLRQASQLLKEGFVLTFDYGYSCKELYSPQRYKGTLICYFRHTSSEDYLQNIGSQDITAHVNFSALKKWGLEVGLEALGFCPQGSYLVSLGLEHVIKILYPQGASAVELSGIKNLILPEGFGQSHKVMVQGKGINKALRLKGFGFRNNLKWL